MDWPWIIFTLVGVGVWILVSVFRKAEEERQRNLPRPAARGPNRGPGQRPMTDLDRFLEEARRRRDQGQRPAQTIEIAEAVPVKRAPRPPREPRRQPAAPRPPERRSDFVPSVRRSASERRPEPLPKPLVAPPKPLPEAILVEVVSEDEKGALVRPAGRDPGAASAGRPARRRPCPSGSPCFACGGSTAGSAAQSAGDGGGFCVARNLRPAGLPALHVSDRRGGTTILKVSRLAESAEASGPGGHKTLHGGGKSV